MKCDRNTCLHSSNLVSICNSQLFERKKKIRTFTSIWEEGEGHLFRRLYQTSLILVYKPHQSLKELCPNCHQTQPTLPKPILVLINKHDLSPLEHLRNVTCMHSINALIEAFKNITPNLFVCLHEVW